MALLLGAMPSVAQDNLLSFQVGAKGGFQLAEMEFNSDALRNSNRTGFFIGPVFRFKMPVTGMSIDLAALYDERQLKVDDEKFTQKSIVIPAHLRMGVSLFDQLGAFVAAGPQLSFNVGDDLLHWITDEGEHKQFILQNTMASINLGFGATIGHHLEAALHYNIPIGKTADFTWNAVTTQLRDETWNHAKSKTNAWRISVCYYF